MRRIISLLSSIKLAVLILTLLIVFSALSTFIPQGESIDFYLENYKLFEELIIFTGLNNFFRSNLFLLLIFLFFINLFTCSTIRILKEIKGLIKWNIGPDIIHCGLLVLLLSAFGSVIYNQEQLIQIKPGDVVQIDDFYLKLNEIIQVDNNNSIYFKSLVSIFDYNNKLESENIEIEVNRPYKQGNYLIYQLSNNEVDSIKLLDLEGTVHNINKDDEFIYQNKRYHLIDVKLNDYAKFSISNQEGNTINKFISINDSLDNLTLLEILKDDYSVLLINREPLYIIIRISFIILLLGLVITYISKIKWRTE